MATLRPQVITSTNVLTSFVSPAGDRVAAMIGTAQWGPVNTVTAITSLNEFVNTFGDDVTGTGLTLIKAADLFFRNGGTLKVVRIVDGDEAKSDKMLVSGVTDMINIEAKYYGTYGDNITVTVEAIGSNRSVTITDGKSTEIYTNAGVGYATNSTIATAINAGSSLVTATVESGQEATLIATSTAAQLTGGDDGEDSLSDSDYTDAIDDLLWTEDYNFLLIPNKTDDAFHSTVVGKLNTRATNEKLYSRYITGITSDEAIATATARTASGKRLTRVAPGVVYTNRSSDASHNLDGSYLACAYAGTLCALDLEVSGTHETVSVGALIVDSSTSQAYYNKTEQEQLLQGGIAPISKIGNSIQMVRGITSYGDDTSVWTDEVIVDIVDYVTELCEDYLNSVIGKPNTADNRAIYSARLDAILQSLINQKIIEEFQSSVVSEGSSADTILAEISIKPTYNANFVLLTINVN